MIDSNFAPEIVATVTKTSPSAKLGIVIKSKASSDVYVKEIMPTSPFVETDLSPGMTILYINKRPCQGLTVEEILAMLASLESKVSIVAAFQQGPMQHIILKKTWKAKAGGRDKTFSFHGQAMNEQIATHIQKYWDAMAPAGGLAKTAKPLKITKLYGKIYKADMNHDFQKYHEEDAVVAVFDAMAELGWEFKFQYDSEVISSSYTAAIATSSPVSSYTKREMFIFYRRADLSAVLADMLRDDSPITTSSLFAPEVVATIVKTLPTSKLGLTVKSKEGAGVYIKDIAPTSPFIGTALKPGMMLLSINQQDCQHLTVPEVLGCLGSLESTVSIKAAFEQDADGAVVIPSDAVAAARAPAVEEEEKDTAPPTQEVEFDC
jgi:predicted metalloprotease with PDZ domain